MRRSRPLTVHLLAACLGVGLAGPAPSIAGSTDPVLVIGEARAGGGSPSRVVELLGAWGFDDILQVTYPLQVVVSQGTAFVRYPVGDAPVAGTFAGLADGLTAGELTAFQAAGSLATGASILRLNTHEMTLALPDTFDPGPVDVVLYVTLPGEGTFLSNTAEAVGAGS